MINILIAKYQNNLKTFFSKAIRERKNVLVSDENLDGRFAGPLRDAIDDDKFLVKVIVVYRPIFQWLPSWYSQISKSTNKDVNGELLKDQNGLPTRSQHTHWPNEGGEKIQNFTSWYRGFVYRMGHDQFGNHHPSIHFMNVYKPLFENVNVYDMYQDGDFITLFHCQMIPEAKKTCAHLKKGISLPLSNPSVNVEHDIISVEAYERGLIDRSFDRPTVVAKVTQFLKRTNKVLPRVCDDETINEIHGWFQESEEIIFPNTFSSTNRKESLESVFDQFASSKLCDVDVDKILADNEWVDFFMTIKNNPK